MLLENLCYVRSWLRHVSTEESIPTGPRVTTTFFDGPRPVTVREPITTNSSPAVVNFTEDATRADHTQHNDSIDTITLPNGRRTTGQVIRPHADRTAYGEFGRVELEEEVPGVSIFIHVDGIGATTAQNRKTAPALPATTPLLEVCWDTSTTTFEFTPQNVLEMITTHHGRGRGAETSAPGAVTADPLNSTTGSLATIDDADENDANSSDGECACRGNNPSAESLVGFIDPTLGMRYDLNFGDMGDLPTGVIHGQSFTPSGHPMETMEKKGGGGSGGFRGGATGGAGSSGGGALTPGRALPPSAGTSASPANSSGRATWSGPSGSGTSTHAGSGGVSSRSGGSSTGRSSLPTKAPDPSVGSALGPTGGVGPMYPGGCSENAAGGAIGGEVAAVKTARQESDERWDYLRTLLARAELETDYHERMRILEEEEAVRIATLIWDATHGIDRLREAEREIEGFLGSAWAADASSNGKPKPATQTSGGGAGAKPPVQTPLGAAAPQPNRHHVVPSWMGGGDDPANLITMPKEEHEALHRDLREHLNTYRKGTTTMCHSSTNSGANIRRTFSRRDRLQAMADFYAKFRHKYPDVAEKFFRNNPQLK